jgi:hypothetical protein
MDEIHLPWDMEPGKFEGMTEDERHATLDDCFEYNDHLRDLALSAYAARGPAAQGRGIFCSLFPAVETAGYYQSSPFGDCARAFGREDSRSGPFPLH